MDALLLRILNGHPISKLLRDQRKKNVIVNKILLNLSTIAMLHNLA